MNKATHFSESPSGQKHYYYCDYGEWYTWNYQTESWISIGFLRPKDIKALGVKSLSIDWSR